MNMKLKLAFNDAKTKRPSHLERCLCWDKFENGYRCYVYDGISKYWCTQATTEHDENGGNHIVDYADYRVTRWASIEGKEIEAIPVDEAAKAYEKKMYGYTVGKDVTDTDCSNQQNIIDIDGAFKAGAKWQKEQKPAEKSSMLQILKEHLANTSREQLDAEFEALKDLTIDKPAEWKPSEEQIVMTAENCPYRSDRVLQDNYGKFHFCYKDGGDCECIPNGCPYLIAKNSKLNLPNLPGYTQI